MFTIAISCSLAAFATRRTIAVFAGAADGRGRYFVFRSPNRTRRGPLAPGMGAGKRATHTGAAGRRGWHLFAPSGDPTMKYHLLVAGLWAVAAAAQAGS